MAEGERKPRSAAQKAATRRMIAANRRGRGGGGRRRSSSGSSFRRSRRAAHPVHRLPHVAAGLLLAEAANSRGSDGTSVVSLAKSGDLAGAAGRFRATWLARDGALSTNSYYSAPRAAAVGAAGVIVVGKVVGALMPSLKRRIKVGKFKFAIAG